jgi:ferritin-like metal-binding protein YciE
LRDLYSAETQLVSALPSLAHRLGDNQTAGILQQTLNEEGEANKKLTAIAESQVNVAATSKA